MKGEEVDRGVISSLEHSGRGIASFVIALVLTVAILMILFMGEAYGPPRHYSDKAPVVSLLIVGGGFVANLVGLGLAIGGLCDRVRKKAFAKWGLALNLLIFAFFLVAVVLPIISTLTAPSAEDEMRKVIEGLP